MLFYLILYLLFLVFICLTSEQEIKEKERLLRQEKEREQILIELNKLKEKILILEKSFPNIERKKISWLKSLLS